MFDSRRYDAAIAFLQTPPQLAQDGPGITILHLAWVGVMQRAYVREELDASIEAAWDCLRDFADISAWAQGRVVTTEGTGVGMIRHVDTRDGRAVERCEAHDDQAHTFSYRLLESPWPFRNYVATVRLTSAGPHRCVIEWSSTFDTDVPAGSMRTQVEQAYRDRFIAKLRDTLRQRQAGI